MPGIIPDTEIVYVFAVFGFSVEKKCRGSETAFKHLLLKIFKENHFKANATNTKVVVHSVKKMSFI